ncbi:hypothetical protein M422DRAFT_104826, partial [Sphaerobolus stellatus SS14]
LNFYRIHVLVFTFTPLIAAGIFYASNGEFHIAFIDALFLCVSSMTVTGLATVDLSSLTLWQQVIMFLLMCLGSPISISWIIVYVRRYYLASKFAQHVMNSRRSSAPSTPVNGESPRGRPFFWIEMKNRLFGKRKDSRSVTWADNKGAKGSKLRPDMIRRLERAPQPVNPSGWLSQSEDEEVAALKLGRGKHHGRLIAPNAAPIEQHPSITVEEGEEEEDDEEDDERNLSDFPRAQTIEFVHPNIDQIREEDGNAAYNTQMRRVRSGVHADLSPTGGHRRRGSSSRFPRTATMQSMRSSVYHAKLRSIDSEFGGFPYPHVILTRLFLRFFPRLKRHLSRTLTVPQTMTIHSQHTNQASMAGARTVAYITFDAIVGRNSQFQGLTHEEMEELGGIEYRALNILLWLVAAYNLAIPIIAYIIIAPYMSLPKWRPDFKPPNQHKFVHPAWYSMFQVVSAYTNAGTSLVDQSLVPFQRAYPLLVLLPLLILMGNTAFVSLPFTDWFFFLVLDIGNSMLDTIPVHIRVGLGFLQATAVRAAGFSTVSLADLSTAVQVLYTVMMYISVYPIAMSVRSTNVYEERSLGIFTDPDNEYAEEETLGEGHNLKVWGSYLAAHARKQLSFDMWWLATSLFLLCIVERSSLKDEANASWFNVFRIIFELTSAYGTVGLSLGLPYANYSFSGGLRPLSKLIVCAVMIRGRHRGLPVAIDRAVMVPPEF